MSRRQGGLLELTFAVILGVLWVRGYLTGWINRLTAAATEAPAKQPFNIPGAARTASGTATPGSSSQVA